MRKSVLGTFPLVFLIGATASGGTFFNDFTSATVSGFQLNGGPRPAPNDALNYPAIENGYLAITYAEGNDNASIIIDDLDGGGQIESFVLTCKLLLGGTGASTRPADGMSFNFAPDLADGSGISEEGAGNGLSLCLDVWDNGSPDRIAFDVKTPQDDGTGTLTPTIVASKPMPDDSGGNGNTFLKTGTNFVDFRIEIKRNGQMDVSFKGSNIFSGEFIQGWQPMQGRFGIGGRTGGAWQNQWVDELRITTVLYSGTPVAPTILTQPQSLTINERDPATFSVVPDGTPLFSYQWYSNDVAIANATNRVYSIASTPATANGSKYKVKVTNAANNVTSADATLTVATDTAPPTIVKVTGSVTFKTATVVFSEPVTAATAGAAGNYSFDNLSISAATVVDPTTVRLDTGLQTEGATYTLTVNNIKDLAVAGNTIAPDTKATLRAFVFSLGVATWERWQDRGGETTPIDTFVMNLSDPTFRAPDVAGTSTYLGSPRNVADNYGLRASGYFVAPTSGNYVFFMSSDDNGYLFLSTDSNPANKKKIASQPAWSDLGQWLDPDLDRSMGAAENSSDQFSMSEWTPANQITLTAGNKYYIELDFQEGGGGDGCEAYYKLASDPDPVNGAAPNVTGRVVGTYADPTGASVTITQQPQNQSVSENSSATFGVAATGSAPTLFYQWQKAPVTGAFTDITAANSANYTTPPLKVADSGTRYRVAITVPGLTTNSVEASVTVVADAVPPTLASALSSFLDNTKVTVVFSELLDAASANVAGNYNINNSVAVNTAALQTDGKSVLLTTTAIAKGTTNTLTVTGVKDAAGNSMAPNSQVPIGFQRGALFVHTDNDPATYNASDTLVQSRLESRGYYVQSVGSTVDDVSMATGKDIIVLSSTFSSGNVTDTYKEAPVPVVEWEQAIQDDMAMTMVGGSTDRGTTTGLTDIEIVNASHPMAAGLSAGVHTVVTGPSEFAWGQPTNTAQVVARLVGTQNACIYGYDKGALLTDGTPAAERRVLFLMTDNVMASLNADGLKLFDAAIDWAQNLTATTAPSAPVITKVSLGANNTIHVEWTGGGTLEVSDKVTGGTWTDTGLSSPADAPIDRAMRFGRVKRSQ